MARDIRGSRRHLHWVVRTTHWVGLQFVLRRGAQQNDSTQAPASIFGITIETIRMARLRSVIIVSDSRSRLTAFPRLLEKAVMSLARIRIHADALSIIACHESFSMKIFPDR
jgi:hypothetical protein